MINKKWLFQCPCCYEHFKSKTKPNIYRSNSLNEMKPNKEIYLPHPQGLGIHEYSSTKKKDLGFRD